MGDITNLRFAQFLKRALALRTVDPGRVLANNVGSVLELQDTYRPEHRLDRGEKLLTLGAQTIINTSNFQVMEVIATGRTFVLKRVSWSLLLPTSTTQPGQLYFWIGNLNTSTGPGTNLAQPKDTRLPNSFGGSSALTTTYTIIGAGIASPSVQAIISPYLVQIYPGAATVPTIHQVDNLDIIVTPGNLITVGIRGDTLTTASYNYIVMVEGYEFTPDPSELQAAPP